MDYSVGERKSNSLDIINDFLTGKLIDLSSLKEIQELKKASRRQISYEAEKVKRLGGVSDFPFKSIYQLRSYKSLIAPKKDSFDKIHLLIKDSNLIRHQPREVQMLEIKYLQSILSLKERHSGCLDFKFELLPNYLAEDIDFTVLYSIIYQILDPFWSLRAKSFKDIAHILSDEMEIKMNKFRTECKFTLTDNDAGVNKNQINFYSTLCYITIRILMSENQSFRIKLEKFNDDKIHSISEAIYSGLIYKFIESRMQIKG